MSGQWRPGGNAKHEVGGDTVSRVLRGALGVREACESAGLEPKQRGAWARAFRRTALRAFDEGLRLSLAPHVQETEALGTTEFRGPLAELPLTDLLQSLALARRDAVIAISHGGAESRLWCSEGEIVDAESGALVGELAVYHLLTLEHGQLSAELRTVRRERRVRHSTAALLLEAARRQDEGDLLRTRFAERRFARSPAAESAPNVAPAEASLLALLDHPLGISELLAVSGLGEYEALTALAALVDARRVVATGASTPSYAPTGSLHPALSLRPPLEAHGVGRTRAARQVLAAALAAAVVALVAWRGPRQSARPATPAAERRERPVALATPAVKPDRAAPSELASAAATLPSSPAPQLGAPLAAPATPAAPMPLAPLMPLARRPLRAGREANAMTRKPLAGDDQVTQPPSASERAVEPLVPRMRIIDEQVPQMQIVE